LSLGIVGQQAVPSQQRSEREHSQAGGAGGEELSADKVDGSIHGNGLLFSRNKLIQIHNRPTYADPGC
jgi:hypothetical protein